MAAAATLDVVAQVGFEVRLVYRTWARTAQRPSMRTIAIVARFGHIGDVTLDELRVELMYPLDADAERFFSHP